MADSSKTRLIRSALVVSLLAASLTLAPASAKADDSTRNEALMGAGSALCSLLYGPAKLLYALGGAAVGGLAWAFSGGDSDVAGPIFTAAFRGDYVVTPDHLNGAKPLVFIGRAPSRASRGYEVNSSEDLYEGF